MTKQVVVVGPTPPPTHGMAVATADVLEILNDEGFDVVHLQLSDPSPGNTMARAWKIARLVRSVHRAVRRRETAFYLTISQSKLGMFRDAALLSAAGSAGTRVAHLHGGALPSILDSAPRAFGLAYERLIASKVDQLWVLDAEARRLFHAYGGFRDVRVVPNAVSRAYARTVDSTTEPRHEVGTRRPLQAVFLSTLYESKGVLIAARAVQSLARAGLPVRLDVYGAAPTQEAERTRRTLLAICREGDAVRYCGEAGLQEKAAALCRADVFLLPTWYQNEGAPIALLEAMYAGSVPVVTSHRSIGELVQADRTAVVVGAASSVDVAEALRRLVHHPELLYELSRNARAWARENASPKSYRSAIASLTTPWKDAEW